MGSVLTSLNEPSPCNLPTYNIVQKHSKQAQDKPYNRIDNAKRNPRLSFRRIQTSAHNAPPYLCPMPFQLSENSRNLHPPNKARTTHTRKTPTGLTSQWAFHYDRTSFFAMLIRFCATFRLLSSVSSASAILRRRTRRPPARPKCGGTWPTDKPWSSQWPKPHLGKRCWHRPMRGGRCKFRQSYPSP